MKRMPKILFVAAMAGLLLPACYNTPDNNGRSKGAAEQSTDSLLVPQSELPSQNQDSERRYADSAKLDPTHTGEPHER